MIRYVRDYYLAKAMSPGISDRSFLRARDDLDDLMSEHDAERRSPLPGTSDGGV